MRLMLVAAAFAAALFFDVRPAPASPAPWCAVNNIGFGDVYWDCRYPSIEACVPNVLAGNRGFCNPNPAYRPPEAGRPHRRLVKKHHHRG